MGDLNSGHSIFDSQSSALSSDPWFTAMPLFGFTDMWRQKNGSKLEYTWVNRRKDVESGFRIDHTFASTAARRRIRSCEYCHSDRERRFSDRSSMVVTIR